MKIPSRLLSTELPAVPTLPGRSLGTGFRPPRVLPRSSPSCDLLCTLTNVSSDTENLSVSLKSNPRFFPFTVNILEYLENLLLQGQIHSTIFSIKLSLFQNLIHLKWISAYCLRQDLILLLPFLQE